MEKQLRQRARSRERGRERESVCMCGEREMVGVYVCERGGRRGGGGEVEDS